MLATNATEVARIKVCGYLTKKEKKAHALLPYGQLGLKTAKSFTFLNKFRK